jgi:hypothetical protein
MQRPPTRFGGRFKSAQHAVVRQEPERAATCKTTRVFEMQGVTADALKGLHTYPSFYSQIKASRLSGGQRLNDRWIPVTLALRDLLGKGSLYRVAPQFLIY